MAVIQSLKEFTERLPENANPQLHDTVKALKIAQEQGKISQNIAVLPGLCDVHVHLREPGQTYKETIATGTAACARGGFTTVGAMPNLNPVPDSLDTLALETAAIKRSALIETLPYAAVTKNEEGAELADINALAPHVIGFSDDGHGVDGSRLMREALKLLAQNDSIVAVHAEDGTIRPVGSCINDGPFAAAHQLIGIPKAAEYAQIERDIEILRELKAARIAPKYHVCHISCGESADLIRQARAEGLDVSCETAMHYLLIDESMMENDGRFKMNPPLRQPEDRAALVEALIDGTIDLIATDHAPHSQEEKSCGLKDSAFGVVGVEISFPLFYTYFVRTKMVSFERAVHLFSTASRERFNIPARDNDFSIWDLDACSKINPEDFLSRGRSTPFAGWEIYGKCLSTIYDGKPVYQDPCISNK